MLVAQRVGSDEALGDSHRAQRERVDLIDRRPGGENDLDTSPTDIDDRGRAPLEIEVAGGAPERQLGFFLTRDHVEADLVLLHDFPGEPTAVGSLSHRAGRDCPQLGDFEAVRDRLHLPDGRERPFYRCVG